MRSWGREDEKEEEEGEEEETGKQEILLPSHKYF
jgi:hypothetical protein